MSVCPICCGTRIVLLPVRGDDMTTPVKSHREYACPECGEPHVDAEEVAVAAALKINFDDSYEPGGEDNISKGQAIEAVMDALRLVIEQHQPRRKAA